MTVPDHPPGIKKHESVLWSFSFILVLTKQDAPPSDELMDQEPHLQVSRVIELG